MHNDPWKLIPEILVYSSIYSSHTFISMQSGRLLASGSVLVKPGFSSQIYYKPGSRTLLLASVFIEVVIFKLFSTKVHSNKL